MAARKRKSPPENQSSSPPPSVSWWDEPLLSPEGLRRGNRFAHSLTALVLLVACLVLWNGYRYQPFLIHENIVPEMVDLVTSGTNELQPIFAGQIWDTTAFDGDQKVVRMRIDPSHPAGFALPKSILSMPAAPRKIAFSAIIVYQGQPNISYGFFRRDMKMDLAALDRLSFGADFNPSPDDFKKTSNVPLYRDRADFPIPIDRADSFFILFTAKVPTELHLHKLAFVGKNQ